jgi:hypothetical protein
MAAIEAEFNTASVNKRLHQAAGRRCRFEKSLHANSKRRTRAPIPWGYNPRVTAFLQFGMHVLTVLFFLGMAGASVVVVISFFEDLKELIGD